MAPTVSWPVFLFYSFGAESGFCGFLGFLWFFMVFLGFLCFFYVFLRVSLVFLWFAWWFSWFGLIKLLWAESYRRCFAVFFFGGVVSTKVFQIFEFLFKVRLFLVCFFWQSYLCFFAERKSPVAQNKTM